MNIETIHESLINGQRRQMARQIDEYGATEFFAEYGAHLEDIYLSSYEAFKRYEDAVISYHRIKER